MSELCSLSRMILTLSFLVCLQASNLTICFTTNELNERGTTVAIYYYANYNEKLLKNKSVFVLPAVDAVTRGASISSSGVDLDTAIMMLIPNSHYPRKLHANCNVQRHQAGGTIPPSLDSQLACDGPSSYSCSFFLAKAWASYAMISEEKLSYVHLSNQRRTKQSTKKFTSVRVRYH